MSKLSIRPEGRRLHVENYRGQQPARDALRKLGATTERDEKTGQWRTWIGSGKRAELEALIDRLNAAPPSEESEEDRLARDRERILGRCRYTGASGKAGSYYVVWHGTTARGEAYRLLLRDGTKTFFADAAKVSDVTLYREPKTLRSLQEYAQRKQTERQTGECQCRCHKRADCRCAVSGYCPVHHDGCDHCGCES